MENLTSKKQSSTPSKKTNLDYESMQNGLNNDNGFSENGLENNRLLNNSMKQQKSE